MTIETALTVARPSAANGAQPRTDRAHSAASGASRASSHANKLRVDGAGAGRRSKF